MAQAALKYDFEVGVYRPPSEGGSDSLLVRFTRNCPWNHCTFCAMYKREKFSIRSPQEIKQDLDAVAKIGRDLRDISEKHGQGRSITRDAVVELIGKAPDLNYHHGFAMVYNWFQSGGKNAFLQDGNSLLMKTEDLVDVLKYLRATFPSLVRVTSYARSKTLAQKKQAELDAIHAAGLDRLHIGLETGDDDLLKIVKKGVTSEGHIKGGRKSLKAGFQVSEYWMPGLGGQEMWEAHALNTALVLNAIDPHYIRSRPFRPTKGTALHAQYKNGEFHMLSAKGQLNELKLMMETLEVNSRVCFDHAGNYWRNRQGGNLFSQGYEGYKFPEQKPEVLALIEEGLSTDQNAMPFIRL